MKISTIQDLLLDEMKDLYDAEKQLVRAIPKMAKAASDSELKDGFLAHLEQTKGQVARIEKAFGALGEKAKSKPCAAMKGLVEEGGEVIAEDMAATVKDCALIGAGRRVEHYEMAGYETAIALAKGSGAAEVAQLLTETLKEEQQTDKKLATLAARLIKQSGREASSEASAGRSSQPAKNKSGGQ